MTVSRSSHAAISVTVDPGPPPHTTPWDLDLRGPLDAAVLEDILGELACDEPGAPAWQHRLLRHGPGHHTLRFIQRDGAIAVSVVGRIADLLTEPPPTEGPLVPGQCAVLTRPRRHRHEAVSVEPGTPLDADSVRRALRAVIAAHPHLRARLDATGGRFTARGTAPAGQDILVEGEFDDEAGFAAAVASLGASLDADTGVLVRALLARDRRTTAGPRADRLAVVVHQLAVDAASWRILLDDLTAALGTAPARTPAARRVPDPLADWVGELRELAADPDEARHWSRVAEHRTRMLTARRSAAVTRSGDAPGTARARTWDSGPVRERHLDVTLDDDLAERVTRHLAARLALTSGQVLTGAFALALARWQRVDEIGFDVRSDPRADRPRLRRHVGRLADVHPVHLALDPGLDALGRLASVAGPLAAGAGQAAGGAGFGACREWSPDPLLRDTLRALAPAPVCLVLRGPDEALPRGARPVTASAPGRPVHRLEVSVQAARGGLRLGLDWTPDPAEGITDTTVTAFADLLRDVLRELADAADAPIPSAFRATPQQSELYRAGDARPGTGRHVEQLVWVWHGPLDLERFTAAWQSVFDCETVLRTAFTGGPEPQLMVHGRVTPDITVRVRRDDDGLSALLEDDRLRGFDLRCPGPLRLTLLGSERNPLESAASPTRIVLTYHRALLDTWSAHILLREFHRAYLAGGSLPGGERRPDLRDYTAWIAAEDLEPVRGYWARSVSADGAERGPASGTTSRTAAATRPGKAGGPGGPGGRGRPVWARGLGGENGPTGVGRSRIRLDSAETIRLARWAALWGIAESSVLQAVWAMLIHRASGATGPAPVCFAVTVPGRGIPLDGVARMLGPLRNALPMSVEVDLADTVPRLLRRLQDHALDMAAYEWVPADWLRTADRHGAGIDPAATVIVFEDPPHPVEGLEGELAAQGIRSEFQGTVPARSTLPIGMLAHHDNAGGLVLTGVHDRDVLDDEAAGELLQQIVLLLRQLPLKAGESTTVADALKVLEGRAVPRMAETERAGGDEPLFVLRAAGREQAGTICLVPPPGAPTTCYDLLAHLYAGPQELLVLTGDVDRARPALAAHRTGRLLLLGGFSGAGVLACGLARRIGADGTRPPRVVLAGAYADEEVRAVDLARALTRSLRDAGDPGS
ncbi:condensation domain-containing protein [Streptomyces sp. NPDC090106]|uniref:condensation domain-containing protein n=1 Tax=Streptomyces sp. NPDC090106 TaxID=3365946 RepID=UPI0037F527EB